MSPGVPTAAAEAPWQGTQENLAASVPDGRLVVAEQSGQYIELEQPELVSNVIARVVAAVRDPGI